MNVRKWPARFPIFLLLAIATFEANATRPAAIIKTTIGQSKVQVGFITPEELKTKLARREQVTIIDVRASGIFAESEEKIKGAIRIKYRKLRSRLAFPPLKNVPRDQEVVTYCACPSDETSIRAAQLLLDSGFTRVRALKGGWQGWLRVSGQVEARQKIL